MIKKLILLVFVVYGSVANAGWYRVTNYVGEVGEYPVHLSLQSMEWANRYIFAMSGKGKIGDRVQYLGAYYYDRRRSPIALYGGMDEYGALRLCEVKDWDKFRREVLDSEEKTRADLSLCKFQLIQNEGGMSGVFEVAGNSYNVYLKKTGELRNGDNAKVKVDGDFEVPFWSMTKKHMLIGSYGCAEPNGFCSIRMNKLIAINRDTGVVDDVIRTSFSDDGAGMSEMAIYQNVESYLYEGGEGVLTYCLGNPNYRNVHGLKTKKK